MISYVLGAPGAGKSTVAPLLRDALPTHVVIDWDAFMDPASSLRGRPVRDDPASWPSYEDLVRTVVEQVLPRPVVLLCVATPDQLGSWPAGRWTLLDVDDVERTRRLEPRADAEELRTALVDAAAHRRLGLPVVDGSSRDPRLVAGSLARVCSSR